MSFISAIGIVSPLGEGAQASLDALITSKKGLHPTEISGFGSFTVGLSPLMQPFVDSSEILLTKACEQIEQTLSKVIAKYGPRRIITLIGSTDNGSYNSYEALKIKKSSGSFPNHFSLHNIAAFKSAHFVKHRLGLGGTSAGVSTACTSSANAILLAHRMIKSGFCDAAVVGGVDIISHSVLLGFHSLEAVDREQCKPFAKNRRGINIGEAAGLVLLTREPFSDEHIFIAGGGETSDAHHMTAPEPNGFEATRAMTLALNQARLAPSEIDYVNLHGTATSLNDSMEAQATHRVFGDSVYASSTKALTGHTLGAAGAIELIFCYLLLSKLNKGLNLIPQADEHEYDLALPPLKMVKKDTRLDRIKYCMSNNFAFGGCNTSIIIGAQK